MDTRTRLDVILYVHGVFCFFWSRSVYHQIFPYKKKQQFSLPHESQLQINRNEMGNLKISVVSL